MKLLKRLFSRKAYNYEQDIRSKLELVFEHEGRKYYRFPKELSLPLNRFANSLLLLELLSSGLSGQEVDMILEVMEKAVHKGLQSPKNAASVVACIQAIKQRKNMIVHKDLLLNIAATFIIREDESATGDMVSTIHDEKVKLFERLAEKEGEHGFFMSLAITKLSPCLEMSQEDFKELWSTTAARTRALKNQLALIGSTL
jgi:hypothetical protein